jgi:hypothetical protein
MKTATSSPERCSVQSQSRCTPANSLKAGFAGAGNGEIIGQST